MSPLKRSRKRVKTVLPIRVWGTDAAGKPFVSLAHTLDVTPTGARIGSFSVKVSPGDRIGITRGMQKAHFRVVWVGTPGSPSEEQIGVELLDADKDIWGIRLPEAEPDDYGAAENRKGASLPAVSPRSAPLPRQDQLSEQLHRTVAQLEQILKAFSGSGCDSPLLEEFCATAAHARSSSIALQAWLGEKHGSANSFSGLLTVNAERVKLASLLCASLARDFPAVRSMIPKSSLDALMQAVGDLFAQLANFELEVDESGSCQTEPDSSRSSEEEFALNPSSASGEACLQE